jgi:Neuraminidase (sialidase)
MKSHQNPNRTAHLLLSVLMLVCLDAVAADTDKPKHDHRAASGVTSLDVYADGDRLHLLIATREVERPPELAYQRSDDGGETWSQPVRVGVGQEAPEPAHRGMDAQIAASGEHVVAVWTTEGTEDRFGRGPMACAYSGDGGKTWKAGPNPADDGKATGHAFVDVTADADGTFHLVWLDNRGADTAGKGLRYARSSDGGASWSANVTVDPVTCECCWNTITTAPGGKVFILYRDRDPRDMAIVTSDDNGRTWSKPVTAGRFGWDINGCPHVGGGLSAVPTSTGVTLHAAVWTAKNETAHGAYALSSTDGGKTWGEPLHLGNSQSWHPDIACEGTTVVAVWDAYMDGGTAVFASASRDGGKAWDLPKRLNTDGTTADHPRIIRTRNGFRAFWTQQATDKGTTWAAQTLP